MAPRRPRLGQHFLVRDDIADQIVELADPGPDDRVLEIGPGTGVLTHRLAATGATVVAIERDRALAHTVRRDLPDIDVLEGDAARDPWPPFDLLVSNLPFQISSPVLFRLFETTGWRLAVVMVQREFADRLVAGPESGDYGRLSVKAALRATAETAIQVPKSAFDPPPEVDATVVRIEPDPSVPPATDPALCDELVDAVFTQRRKTIRNGLTVLAERTGLDLDALRGVASELDVDGLRPGQLTPTDFVELADAVAVRLPKENRDIR